jgi:hypothetical protein
MPMCFPLHGFWYLEDFEKPLNISSGHFIEGKKDPCDIYSRIVFDLNDKEVQKWDGYG